MMVIDSVQISINTEVNGALLEKTIISHMGLKQTVTIQFPYYSTWFHDMITSKEVQKNITLLKKKRANRNENVYYNRIIIIRIMQ